METLFRLLLGLVFLFASAGSAVAQDLVAQGIEAMGGERALGELRTIAIRGQDIQWEYESSYEPGPKAQQRQSGEAKFTIQRDLVGGNARIDWERRVVRTTPPLNFKYSEIIAGGIGYVNGIDSTDRIEASKKSNPPGHPMSGGRTAATLRELTRQSPRLLLDMKNDARSVKAIAAQTVGGKELPAVQYDLRGWSFVVMFDPDTRLPARIRTRDGDPIQGDSNYDLVLADWRTVGGARVAHALTYQLNGRDMIVIKYDQVTPNPAFGADLFEIPSAAKVIAVRSATGNVPYQWIIRRGYWGNLTDSDAVAWDGAARAEPELVDIAPGVSQSRGTSHNSVVVEMEKYLVVFDAPIGEPLSEWMIRASKQRYPGKPIGFLMLTHHHWDHASGARTYAAEGATVIVGKGNKEHFERMFSAPGAALNDRLHRNPRKAEIIEVSEKYTLKDGKREIEMYSIETGHSTGTLIAYIPDAKLGFVADLWSPGRDPLPAKPNQNQIDLVNGVKRHGLNPEKFAAGHGTTGDYAPLAKLVGGD
ncbi:MAG TPA: MBL fold metallo-hydrolase [Pseudolabrys sp.]|jgi:glyoxylase-like metal-dependent hydrolase (beta-lactamase superfamily II)|nr:MBL fold metallo-hydrolase [Pseudolabrys sp.]